MYITYDTKQYPIFADGDIALYGDRKTSKLQALKQSNERPPPGIRHLMTLSPCNNKKKQNPFRPPRLVRISDMAVVPGTEASKEGYCALSYAWNWSGDIVVRAKDNSIRVDKAKHKLIFHRPHNLCFPTTATKTKTERQQENQQRDNKNENEGENGEENENVTSFVKFEDAIQQICKDFNIRYIWYDYLCIDKKKPRTEQDIEMRQMHQYYSNAQYTVVLVPEMKIIRKIPLAATVATESTYYPIGHHNISRCIRAIHDSQWSMRAWTYQEAISSQRLLFVGENTHLWSDSMRHLYYSQLAVASTPTRMAAYYVKSLCEKHQHQNHIMSPSSSPTIPQTTASTILRHFHARRSTKEHDRLFALSNIFHNIIDLDITSKELVTTQMINLYSKIANQDLTILCFGKPATAHPSTIQQYYSQLPSWTGVSGKHVYVKNRNIKDATVEMIHYGNNKTQKSFWPPINNNNKEKSTANNDVTIRIQKLVRKVVITLAIANNKIKTAPNNNKSNYNSNIDNNDNDTYSSTTAKRSYIVRDGLMHICCECIYVSVELIDLDDRFGRFSTEQFFSYETTFLPIQSLRADTTTNNGFKNHNSSFSSTRLWMDSRDLAALKETTGLQITHTLLLNSVVPATNLTDQGSMVSSICFSLTTPDCSECVILSGISFDIQHCNRRFKAYPVIKRSSDNDNYQSIGLCFVRSTFKLFNNSGRIQKQRFAIK